MTQNFGLCADCDKEVELAANGHCSICQSSSTMKRGAISELELAISSKQERAIKLCDSIMAIVYCSEDRGISILDGPELADNFVKALEDYKNV